jgi:hypothetical protein
MNCATTTVNIKGRSQAQSPIATLTPGLPATGDALVTATGKTLKIIQRVSSTGILMNGWEVAPA